MRTLIEITNSSGHVVGCFYWNDTSRMWRILGYDEREFPIPQEAMDGWRALFDPGTGDRLDCENAVEMFRESGFRVEDPVFTPEIGIVHRIVDSGEAFDLPCPVLQQLAADQNFTLAGIKRAVRRWERPAA